MAYSWFRVTGFGWFARYSYLHFTFFVRGCALGQSCRRWFLTQHGPGADAVRELRCCNGKDEGSNVGNGRALRRASRVRSCKSVGRKGGPDFLKELAFHNLS